MDTSAGFVLLHGQKVLLLHYPQGHWDFPKGGIECGESEEQTARRELEEETGITDIVILPGFREIMRYTYKKSGGRFTEKQVIFFLATTHEEQVRLSHEHIGYIWLPFSEAMSRLTFANARDILTKARSFHHF